GAPTPKAENSEARPRDEDGPCPSGGAGVDPQGSRGRGSREAAGGAIHGRSPSAPQRRGGAHGPVARNDLQVGGSRRLPEARTDEQECSRLARTRGVVVEGVAAAETVTDAASSGVRIARKRVAVEPRWSPGLSCGAV